MATRKRLFLIYKIENFADTQFWKVTKFQGASLFRCGVLSHLLGMGWKTPPPPPPPSAYRVKAKRNWPTLLAKHYCFCLKSGVTFLSIANDSKTNKCFCQAILASFAMALVAQILLIQWRLTCYWLAFIVVLFTWKDFSTTVFIVGEKAMSYQTNNQTTEIKEAIHIILTFSLHSDSCVR